MWAEPTGWVNEVQTLRNGILRWESNMRNGPELQTRLVTHRNAKMGLWGPWAERHSRKLLVPSQRR